MGNNGKGEKMRERRAVEPRARRRSPDTSRGTVQSPPSPDFLRSTSAPDVRTGGILIVVDRTVPLKEVTQSLRRISGFKNVTTSRELADEQAPEVDAVILEHSSVIVVPARKEESGELSALANRLTDVKMEPERYVWATQIDPAWLRGYRDGINALYDSVLAQDVFPVEKKPGVPPPPGVLSSSVSSAASYVDGPTELWGLQAVGVSSRKATGRGVRVAVLDTGIDQDHPSFNGRIASTRSFINDIEVADGHGHGTHCAGTICGIQASAPVRFGVTPDVELYVGKVLTDAGYGKDGDILAGIEWAIDEECHVLSMSLGSDVPVPSIAYEQAASTALDEGILVIAAAGNNASRPLSRGFIGQPANAASVLAVAAIDQQLGIATFSSGGTPGQPATYPDLAAPGVKIFSSWPQPGLYRSTSGTSMACPHTAAAAAAWAEATGLRGRELWRRLLSGTRRLTDIECDIGRGLVQLP